MKNENKNNKNKNIYAYIKSVLIISITLILVGSVFIAFSLRKEVLDNKYKIAKVTTYNSSVKKLSPGELYVTKDIDYTSNGIYRITYRVKYNGKNATILKNKTNFEITDVIGSGYKLLTDNVLYNKERVNNFRKQGIFTNYRNNTFNIIIPATKLDKSCIIQVYVKLESRRLNIKHYISKEAYFTFVPNDNNNFYVKNGPQSYIIVGNGYIVLEKK